jgi:hypothetical protein
MLLERNGAPRIQQTSYLCGARECRLPRMRSATGKRIRDLPLTPDKLIA